MELKRFSVWGDLLAVATIFLAATLLAGSLLSALNFAGVAPSPELPGGALSAIVYSAQFVLAICGIAGYYLWQRCLPGGSRETIFRLSWHWYNPLLTILGIVLVFAASVVLEPVMSLFPERYFDDLAGVIGSGGWAILLSVVLAPVLEELFFRGLVLEQTRRRWSAWQAVGVSALLFALAHLPNLPQMVYALVMAVLIGYIYVLTDSLISVMVIHATNNAISYMILETQGTMNTDLRGMIADNTLYWSIWGASALVVAVSLAVMIKVAGKRMTRKREFEAVFNTKIDEPSLNEKTD